ncbi:hypothetical protein RCL1_002323 [Eukaryota sp. TZLM3-RCL]
MELIVSFHDPYGLWHTHSDAFRAISPLEHLEVTSNSQIHNLPPIALCYIHYDPFLFRSPSEPLSLSRHPLLSLLLLDSRSLSSLSSSQKQQVKEWIDNIPAFGEFSIILISSEKSSIKFTRKFIDSLKSEFNLASTSIFLKNNRIIQVNPSSISSFLVPSFTDLLSCAVTGRLKRCLDICDCYQKQIEQSDGQPFGYLRAKAALANVYASITLDLQCFAHWKEAYDFIINCNNFKLLPLSNSNEESSYKSFIEASYYSRLDQLITKDSSCKKIYQLSAIRIVFINVIDALVRLYSLSSCNFAEKGSRDHPIISLCQFVLTVFSDLNDLFSTDLKNLNSNFDRRVFFTCFMFNFSTEIVIFFENLLHSSLSSIPLLKTYCLSCFLRVLLVQRDCWILLGHYSGFTQKFGQNFKKYFSLSTVLNFDFKISDYILSSHKINLHNSSSFLKFLNVIFSKILSIHLFKDFDISKFNSLESLSNFVFPSDLGYSREQSTFLYQYLLIYNELINSEIITTSQVENFQLKIELIFIPHLQFLLDSKWYFLVVDFLLLILKVLHSFLVFLISSMNILLINNFFDLISSIFSLTDIASSKISDVLSSENPTVLENFAQIFTSVLMLLDSSKVGSKRIQSELFVSKISNIVFIFHKGDNVPECEKVLCFATGQPLNFRLKISHSPLFSSLLKFMSKISNLSIDFSITFNTCLHESKRIDKRSPTNSINSLKFGGKIFDFDTNSVVFCAETVPKSPGLFCFSNFELNFGLHKLFRISVNQNSSFLTSCSDLNPCLSLFKIYRPKLPARVDLIQPLGIVVTSVYCPIEFKMTSDNVILLPFLIVEGSDDVIIDPQSISCTLNDVEVTSLAPLLLESLPSMKTVLPLPSLTVKNQKICIKFPVLTKKDGQHSLKLQLTYKDQNDHVYTFPFEASFITITPINCCYLFSTSSLFPFFKQFEISSTCPVDLILQDYTLLSSKYSQLNFKKDIVLSPGSSVFKCLLHDTNIYDEILIKFSLLSNRNYSLLLKLPIDHCQSMGYSVQSNLIGSKKFPSFSLIFDDFVYGRVNTVSLVLSDPKPICFKFQIKINSDFWLLSDSALESMTSRKFTQNINSLSFLLTPTLKGHVVLPRVIILIDDVILEPVNSGTLVFVT